MRLKISFVFSFIALIISLFFITIILFSQVTEEWVARYNGLGYSDDEAYAIAVDSSGNVYVTGVCVGLGTGHDYATIKYNSLGVEQWVKIYNGPVNGWDAAYAIAIDSSGNIYVTGESDVSKIGPYSYSRYYVTVKYTSAGIQQWVAKYKGPGDYSHCAYAIDIDNSGNVYVTGESDGSGTSWDYATVKYNSSGVQQWAERYNGPGNDWDAAYAIAIDSSGNIYVTGRSVGSYTYYDYATVKYNSAGVQQWVKIYDGPGNDWDSAEAIAIDSSDNVYVTGGSNGGSYTYYDYATIKYNSAGVQQWVKRYNGPVNGYDYAEAIAIDNSGNVYVTGYSDGSGTGLDYTTVKYNSAGIQQWVKRYNGPGNSQDWARALAIDSSSNVYVTGESWGSGTAYDYATIKYNSSGIQQWVKRYNGPGNSYDEATSIAIDNSGNVYVTGKSYGSGTYASYDYATIKYSQSTFSDVFYLY